MRKVGPVNGLKVRVIEELARVLLEGDEWFADLAVLVNRRELEGDTWREESHGLSGEHTGAAPTGIASANFYLPSFASPLFRQEREAKVKDRG
jgi:hypothetical protein